MLFYVAFNSQGHIATGSLQVEKTSAYCTVNHRASASNYQLSNMKHPARDSNWWPQRLESRTLTIFLFVVLCHFQHCTGDITTGRGNQYIQFIKVLYCKLPTNDKQLPAFPLKAVPGTEPQPQRWEARVLALCHRGPHRQFFSREIPSS